MKTKKKILLLYENSSDMLWNSWMLNAELLFPPPPAPQVYMASLTLAPSKNLDTFKGTGGY